MADSRRPSAWTGPAFRPGRRLCTLLIGLATWAGPTVSGQDLERDPIKYRLATPRNVVTALQDRIAKGDAKLAFEPGQGYLRSLLRELDVPESSQVLVFSKTSLQRQRISPKTPRAIYFNDDVMVGFCVRGQALEISAVDEAIGTTYYTLGQEREAQVVLERQTESCLLCHASSANQGVPGHLIRSVYVDRQGLPLLASGSFRTDHASPLPERWGGWYVTGTSGRQQHMGNLISRGPRRPEKLENDEGVNVVDLKGRFPTSLYPTPHSDIVALMVLEHQVGMLNRLARAGMETRMAMHDQAELNKALGQSIDTPSESAQRRIRSVAEAVVPYMLFHDEIALTDRIQGTSSFAADFVKRGPRDAKGRSLRDLDLKTRLFRYPCSYLIHSRAFDSLPREVKTLIYEHLWEILNGRKTNKDDPQLAAEDRLAILEILRATKSDLPDSWKVAPRPPAPR